MKTPIRYRSQLITRRSYKPARRITLKFSPGTPFTIPVQVVVAKPVAVRTPVGGETLASAA